MSISTNTAKKIVDQIIVDLENCPDDLDTATHFQFVTEDYANTELTDAVCSSDCYDTILTIDNEHWLLTDENNGYSATFIGEGDLLYGWTEEMIGDALSEDQKGEFQDVLQFLLAGVKVVNRELSLSEKAWHEYFLDKLDNSFQAAVNQVFK